jgi:hypothetical protein
MTYAIIGTTQQVSEFFFGPPQHDEHCRGWRWELYTRAQRRTQAERDLMLITAARKMAAERRARIEALQAEIQTLEAAE